MRPFLLHGLGPAAVCAAALVMTSQTRADLITVYAGGDYEVTDSSEFSETLGMSLDVFSQTGGFGITSVDVTLTHEFTEPGPDPMSGSLTLFGAMPSDFLMGDFAGTWQASDEEPTLSSFSGTWASTGAGGAFASLTGAGALGGVAIMFDAMIGSASLLLTAEIVPGPPVAGLFGLGVLAGRRRRRI